MTSLQSTLGDGDIADELAATQRQISIAEFFEKNKHMLGFDSGARALVTAVKEAVDNALDATEEAGFLPDIYIEISENGEYYNLVVEDNGPGITKEQIPKVFGKLLYGSRFHVREMNRGQQGIGISAAVLYSQLTSGTPAKITSKTPSQDTANYFELIIDTDENEPEIQVDKTTAWERPHGTRIELTLEANMRARTQLHNYIRQTAVVNPHARIELTEPDAHLKSDRATDQLPKETEEIRPHPHGVELGTVIKMLQATDSYSLSGFLQEEFTRVGKKTADDIADGFRDHFYGREMAYRPPPPGTDPDLEAEIRAAVSNKGKQATKAFADRVVNGDDGIRGIHEYERITNHELTDLVEVAADRTESESGTTFGRTVREKARTAAWRGITADLVPTLYKLVDEATTSRKDDATVEGIAERLSSRLESMDDDRHRLTEETLRSYVDWAADRVEGETDESFGETSRENVIEATWSAMRTVPNDPPKTKDLANDRDAAAALLSGMRTVDVMAPPTDCLSPITDDLILEGLKKEFDADFYAAETRDAEVHGGDPFIVEAGIAYGGDLDEEGAADLLRFANRVPLVYQQGACAITDVVRDIGWRNYGLDQPGGSGMPQGPAVIMVHVASTNVPFTSESKDAVANIPAIEHEVELAIRGAARDLKSFLNKRRSLEKRRQKQDVIARILPRMAQKLASVTNRDELEIDDSLARIMNNVLVERYVEDGTVKVVVENHSETRADIEVTEIVSVQPMVSDGASVVDMDGEWFIKWSPRVESGDEVVLEYDLDGGADDATFDIQVDGLEDAKLTVNA